MNCTILETIGQYVHMCLHQIASLLVIKYSKGIYTYTYIHIHTYIYIYTSYTHNDEITI